MSLVCKSDVGCVAGSCWAHAALSSLADRHKIVRKAQWPDIQYSVQVYVSYQITKSAFFMLGYKVQTFCFFRSRSWSGKWEKDDMLWRAICAVFYTPCSFPVMCLIVLLSLECSFSVYISYMKKELIKALPAKHSMLSQSIKLLAFVFQNLQGFVLFLLISCCWN